MPTICRTPLLQSKKSDTADNSRFYILIHIINNFIHLPIYADDTVIMSESKEDMLNQLNVFNDVCKKWKLKVNAEKSKVLVLSNGRLPANLKFTYNNRDLEIFPNCFIENIQLTLY
jgi:hypothetical protein